MLWLSDQERLMLTMLGIAGLVALGLLTWQNQKQPIRVERMVSAPKAKSWDEALEASRRVDINQATVADLESLPGIGPKTAQKIVDYRTEHSTFQSTDELLQIEGIGPRTYEGLKDYIQ